MKKIYIIIVLVAISFTSCKTAAPIAKSVAYKGLYDEKPLSLLIMPPINKSVNVEAKEYPNVLITTGLHDSQVQYWEPAKWTAKLRELKTDNNILVFKTDMSAGHGGASGRFESLKEDALEYAFLLKLENKNE